MIRKIFIALCVLFLALLSLSLYNRFKPSPPPENPHFYNAEQTSTPEYFSVPELDEKRANETNTPEFLDFDDVLNADAFEDLDAELKSAMERYQVHTHALIWVDAALKCWRDGGNLATPSDATEAHLLSRILKFTATHAEVIDANTTDAMHVGFWYYFSLDQWVIEEGVNFSYDRWLNSKLKNNPWSRQMNVGKGAVILPNGRLTNELSDQKLFYACDTKPMKEILPGSIGEGYEPVGKKEFVYKLHGSPLTWFDALDVCEGEGGALAAPNNQEQAGNITEWIFSHKDLTLHDKSRDVFFGLNDLAQEGFWTYPNGYNANFRYFEWLHGIPKGNRTKNCAAFLPSGMCVDVSCQEAKPFVCQKVNPSPPKEEVNYEEMQGIGLYAFHAKKRNWWQALLTCRLENASLAVPDSKEEAQLLSNLRKKFPASNTERIYDDGYIHVGVHDLDGDKIWRTIDGKRVYNSGFNEWYKSYSRYTGAYNSPLCGSMQDGKYDFTYCDNQYAFICEKPLQSINFI